MSLCKNLGDRNFKSDLRPIYHRAERHTRQLSELQPTYKDLRPKEDPTTRKWNWQFPRPYLTVKNGCGPCRFQWRVGPSYCEYPGVTYDLLVSNIGGTYDLTDQLPSNREFGHFLRGPISIVRADSARFAVAAVAATAATAVIAFTMKADWNWLAVVCSQMRMRGENLCFITWGCEQWSRTPPDDDAGLTPR